MPTKAKQPFQFKSSSVLVKLTGRRVNTLRKLWDGIRQVTGSSIFQHTYHAFRERHFVPEVPQNDFAYWVGEVLRERSLGERLAEVDPYEFTDIRSLRNRLLAIIEDHFKNGGEDVKSPEGQEFHFLESVSFVIPTPFVVYDLRGFREALSKVSLRSVYYHFLEARLHIGRKTNDFSLWLAQTLGEGQLAADIERIDFSISTLEDVKNKMLELLDKRLAQRRRRRLFGIGLLGSTILTGIAGMFRFLRKGKGHGGT